MRFAPDEFVADTSMLLAMFRRDAGDLQTLADDVHDGVGNGDLSLLLLDLAAYEFVNVQVRRHGAPIAAVVAAIADLFELADHVIRVDAMLAGSAGEIAATTGLSGYDAAFLAAGRFVAAPVLTLDDRLAAAGGVHLRQLR